MICPPVNPIGRANSERFFLVKFSIIKKSFRVFDGEHLYECKTHKSNINRIKKIVLRDKGSLYVKIRPTGVGYVLDEELFN